MISEIIQLKGIKIRNVATHINTDIDFTGHSGLVVVTGHNKDSLKSSDQSNGAGKSVPFSLIPSVRYESTPLSPKKANKKDVHTTKGSSIELSFRSPQGVDVSVTQKGTSYVYCENGKDLKKQTQAYVKDALEKHFPVSQSEFYSYTYLQFQRNMEFQYASPAQRLDYITKMFRLDIFDKLRTHFNQERGKIKDFEKDFQSAILRLEDLDRKLLELAHPNDADSTMVSLEKDLTDVRTVYDTKLSSKSLFEADIKNITKIKNLSKKVAKYQEHLGTYDKAMLKRIRKKFKAASAWNTFNKTIAPLLLKEEELKASLAEVPKSIVKLKAKSLVSLEEELENKKESLEKSIRKAKDSNEDIEEVLAEVSLITKKLKAFGYKSHKDVPKDSVDDQVLMARSVIEMHDAVTEHDHVANDTCPLCRQSLDLVKIGKSAKKAKKLIGKLKEVQKAQALIVKRKSYSKELKSLGKLINFSKQEDELQQVIKELAMVEDKLDQYESYINLKKRLADIQDSIPSKPDVKKPKENASELAEQEEEYEEYEEIYKSYLSLKKNLKDVDFSDDYENEVSAKLKALNKKLDKLNKKGIKLNKRFMALQSSKTKYEIYTSDRKAVRSELKQLKPFVGKRRVVDGLHKFYGASNAKLTHAMDILKQLENSLNRYQSLTFPEPMRFEFEQTALGISAKVYRSNGEPSDISNLSGGESSCFRLLWAFALLPLIPPHRRTDTIILDEPDTACDATVRQLLIEEFLPKLRTVVPNVFWITPLSTEIFGDNCDRWVVTKTKGRSKLTKKD